ncbi:hypothetical protein COO60DRAFT_1025001 [Scenedesmus sp. NREL 46B-D3]|nr:hypothetical protein COO60DRAFT_1025001 [Scenedesmus sp. NREL 46B-D3]
MQGDTAVLDATTSAANTKMLPYIRNPHLPLHCNCKALQTTYARWTHPVRPFIGVHHTCVTRMRMQLHCAVHDYHHIAYSCSTLHPLMHAFYCDVCCRTTHRRTAAIYTIYGAVQDSMMHPFDGHPLRCSPGFVAHCSALPRKQCIMIAPRHNSFSHFTLLRVIIFPCFPRPPTTHQPLLLSRRAYKHPELVSSRPDGSTPAAHNPLPSRHTNPAACACHCFVADRCSRSYSAHARTCHHVGRFLSHDACLQSTGSLQHLGTAKPCAQKHT